MSEFEKCLKRRGLVRFSAAGPDVVDKELASAQQDLADAELVLEHGRFKRATATGYYVMFHGARALLLDKGYAEKSHYCLLVAFRELFGGSDEGRELAVGIERARILREDADYHAEFSEESARAVVAVARRFLDFARAELAGGQSV